MSGVNAVVLIKAETSLINELAEQLAELPGVAEVFSVAGQYDLVALVRVRENEELAERLSCPVASTWTEARQVVGFRRSSESSRSREET